MMVLLALALASSPARAAAPELGINLAQLMVDQTRHTRLDLWRPYPDSDKVLVPVGLPDGSEVLFVVDTGAATSVITAELADRLKLDPTEEAGFLQGLSGTVRWSRTSLPRITLGDFRLNGVEVAVGVAGVPDHLGALPIAGILGNNVWMNFVMVLDYPADVLDLYLPGEINPGRKAEPLFVRGGAAATPVRMWAGKDGEALKADAWLEVDTGAHDLLLFGPTAEPLRGASSLGEEPILGVGADLDKIPDRQILQPTRRVVLTTLKAGGTKMRREMSASWLCVQEPPREDGTVPLLPEGCGSGPQLPGLIGYSVLKDSRVILDFPGGRFRITRSEGPPRHFDALAEWLARDQAAHPDDPHHAVDRAIVSWARRDLVGAVATVRAGLEKLPGDPSLTTLLAALLRTQQDWQGAMDALATLPPGELVAEGDWVAYIGSLVLAGRASDALQIARDALDTAPPDEREDYLVALSDALLANGQLQAASAAIDEANDASPRGGSAHLLRKARIASTAKDRYGAMVAIRELIDIVPMRGQPVWWYAQLAGPADLETFRQDVTHAMDRLHPGDEPYDFLGAAWIAVGDPTEGNAALDAGRVRDCIPLTDGPDQDNCEAWYRALRARPDPEADALIRSALAADPGNSAYLDTAGMVALASGRVAEAAAYALTAARMDPDDPYLLWQLDRLNELAAGGSSAARTPSAAASPVTAPAATP